MKKQQAVEHFGNQTKLAHALGITPSAVSLWKDIVPLFRQLQLERLTGGALKASPDAWQHKTEQAS